MDGVWISWLCCGRYAPTDSLPPIPLPSHKLSWKPDSKASAAPSGPSSYKHTAPEAAKAAGRPWKHWAAVTTGVTVISRDTSIAWHKRSITGSRDYLELTISRDWMISKLRLRSRCHISFFHDNLNNTILFQFKHRPLSHTVLNLIHIWF